MGAAEAIIGDDADDDESESDTGVNLDVDDNNFAILPPRGDRHLDICKQVIRKYETTNYSKCGLHL